MKICLSSTANNLDAQLDPRFGRCPYFLIVDPKTLQYEAIPNPALTAVGGAGIQAAQAMINKKVDTVITGNIGPNAFKALNAAGIQILIEPPASILQIIEKYNTGKIQQTQAPTVSGHHNPQLSQEKKP